MKTIIDWGNNKMRDREIIEEEYLKNNSKISTILEESANVNNITEISIMWNGLKQLNALHNILEVLLDIRELIKE